MSWSAQRGQENQVLRLDVDEHQEQFIFQGAKMYVCVCVFICLYIENMEEIRENMLLRKDIDTRAGPFIAN